MYLNVFNKKEIIIMKYIRKYENFIIKPKGMSDEEYVEFKSMMNNLYI